MTDSSIDEGASITRIVRVVVDEERRPLEQLERISGTDAFRRTFNSPEQACAMHVNALLCDLAEHRSRYQRFLDVDELTALVRTFDSDAVRSVAGWIQLLADDERIKERACSVRRWLRIVANNRADVLREMAPREARHA